jgi:hypothetical protein
MIIWLIHRYQTSAWFNRLVRKSVKKQHAIFKPELRPCPYAGANVSCSRAAAAHIQAAGAMAAVPVIAAGMIHCSGGGVSEERFQWCI